MNGNSKWIRETILGVLGAAVTYNQFWQKDEPSELGVLLILFLFGLIPAFRLDEGGSRPLNLLAALLGGARPAPPEDPVADQEARVERAVRAAEVRRAARAELEERADREARTSKRSRRASKGQD